MDVSKFRERLSALGADLSAWPIQEADAAVALLAQSDEAVALFAGASGVDIGDQDETVLADAVLGAAAASVDGER